MKAAGVRSRGLDSRAVLWDPGSKGGEEVSGRLDGDAIEAAEPQQVRVAGDDHLGLCGDRTLEDTVVGWIARYRRQAFQRAPRVS